MNKPNYISVGIDVGLSFSLMSIVDQYEQVILKPFKIIHNNPDSLARAVSAIKKAKESNSMKSRTFLESTGIYHFRSSAT
jgi:transposase